MDALLKHKVGILYWDKLWSRTKILNDKELLKRYSAEEIEECLDHLREHYNLSKTLIVRLPLKLFNAIPAPKSNTVRKALSKHFLQTKSGENTHKEM